jgi:nitrite reductase (NADH) small subunit
MTVALALDWIPVCAFHDLNVERGVAALVGGEQVALFRTADDSVFAIANLDPFSGAYVLSRGIVGSRGDTPVVMSPMFKQAIDLRTGRAVDDPTVTVQTWPVRVVGGVVEVGR